MPNNNVPIAKEIKAILIGTESEFIIYFIFKSTLNFKVVKQIFLVMTFVLIFQVLRCGLEKLSDLIL